MGDMPNMKKMSGLVPAIFAVALTVGLVIGYAACKYGTTSTAPGKGLLSDGYSQGYAAAKDKLERSGVLVPEPKELRHLTGTVTNVGESSFTVTVDDQVLNPLVTDVPLTREVVIDANTKINVRSPRDPAAVAKELQAFKKPVLAPPTGSATPPVTDIAPPSQFETAIGSIGDVKVGMHVQIETTGDVKAQPKFAAATVSLDKNAAPPDLQRATVPLPPSDAPVGPPSAGAAIPPVVVPSGQAPR